MIFWYRYVEFLAYLKDNEEDQSIYLKFIRCLPPPILKIMRAELKKIMGKSGPLEL